MQNKKAPQAWPKKSFLKKLLISGPDNYVSVGWSPESRGKIQFLYVNE